jgi:hypothetical protein
MNFDLNTLIPSGVNAILLIIVTWFIRRWMDDLCARVTRIEDTYIKKEG